MEFASPGIGFTVLVFIVVLTLIVFIHELGHYLAARYFGVRVAVFSVGFGRELFGWNDSHGTRWKISALPFGGYVKFFGDAGVASQRAEEVDMLTAEEKAVSFHHKPLWQRMIIVAAGPLINILTAVFIYWGLFATLGQSVTPPVVTAVSEATPAAEAGFQVGDEIIAIDGEAMTAFEDIIRYVVMRPNENMVIEVKRGDRIEVLRAAPARVEQVDRFGNRYEIGRLGLAATGREFVEHGIGSALIAAFEETAAMVDMMVTALWDIIVGKRSVDELAGPVGIAKMTGEQASLGPLVLISFIALISVNLGFVNLLPIPMLDGGHLVFYAFEAVAGRPVSPKVQEMAMMAGLAMVFSLFVFLTWNDLASIGVWDRLSSLFS